MVKVIAVDKHDLVLDTIVPHTLLLRYLCSHALTTPCLHDASDIALTYCTFRVRTDAGSNDYAGNTDDTNNADKTRKSCHRHNIHSHHNTQSQRSTPTTGTTHIARNPDFLPLSFCRQSRTLNLDMPHPLPCRRPRILPLFSLGDHMLLQVNKVRAVLSRALRRLLRERMHGTRARTVLLVLDGSVRKGMPPACRVRCLSRNGG